MSFLAPLFFLGTLAVALPVVFHLIRRSVKERTVFSSLMFLLPSPPRLTRRSRLEHLVLLLLRCTALVLLATGFARPFLRHALPAATSPRSAKRVLVLLDSSASMQRQKLWDKALQKAEAIVREAPSEDAVALFTFDRQLKALVSFDDWKNTPAGERLSMVRNRLAQAKPGWFGTWLDKALIEAAEIIADTGKEESHGRRQIVLLTDLQEGSRVSALQGHEWPRDVEVVLERIIPQNAGNAGLQLVTDTSETAATPEATVRMRISNASDSKREQFHAVWSTVGGATLSKAVDVYVPPGQSRVIALPVPATDVRADRILLQGDEETFDNSLFVVPPQRVQHTVIYIGSDSETETQEPLFFLRRALQETRSESIRIVKREASAPLPAAELEAATLVVLTARPAGAQAEQLANAVARGKALLFAPISPEAAASLGQILGGAPLSVRENKPERYAMLGEIEFRHPLFVPFSDSRYSDFTKIHFWKYRRFDIDALPQARILARFDTEDPAIFEIPKGKGRVFVFASGWHPADSQLALSSKFVPLLYSLLELSGATPAPPAQYVVGDTVPLPPEQSTPAKIQLPDRSFVQLDPGETNFSQTFMPGIYTLVSAQPVIRFAVNVDPAESRTAPMAADELERLGVPGTRFTSPASASPQGKVRLQNAELESRQKLWRWFILATLAVLGVESWLAGWTARRSVPQEQNA